MIKFYGYFFYETAYKAYRLAIIQEYFESKYCLDHQLRKRREQKIYWKGVELEAMLVSLIGTLSYM